MRFAIISKGLSLSQIEAEALRVGAKGIKAAKLLNQVFCEIDGSQAEKLARVPGLKVKPLKEYKTDQVVTEPPPVETLSDVFYLLRSNFTPPLTGAGLTVAVLDSGIRKTHQSLKSKVVYEANYSNSATSGDVFGHGTQVAFVVAGGMHALGEKAGVSPGASLMNIIGKMVLARKTNALPWSTLIGAWSPRTTILAPTNSWICVNSWAASHTSAATWAAARCARCRSGSST